MEFDVIEDAFIHVLSNEYSDMVYEKYERLDDFWNSDILYEGCTIIWSQDYFTKICSRLAQKYHQTTKKFRAPGTADILACLKFETNAEERSPAITKRRLQFSTGFSISVENLFPCDEEKDSLSENSDDIYLNDSEFADVEFEDFLDYLTPQLDTAKEHADYLEDIDQNETPVLEFYSNPFDPNFFFDGFTEVFGRSFQTSRDPGVCTDGPNFLLAFDDPVKLVNDYLQEHRNYIHHLSRDLDHVIKKDVRKSNDKFLEELEKVARRNISELDSDQLWLKINSTKHLWPEREHSNDEGYDSTVQVENFAATNGNTKEDRITIVEATSPAKKYPELKYSTSPFSVDSFQSPLVSADTSTDTQGAELASQESSNSDLKPVEEIVQFASKKYAGQNYTEEDIQQLLVSVLREKCKEIPVEGTSVDPVESNISKEWANGGSKTEPQESSVDGPSGAESCVAKHLTHSAAQIEGTCSANGAGALDFQNIQQSHHPSESQQGPLLKYPYDSSMFWKGSDVDQQLIGGISASQPSVPVQGAASQTLVPTYQLGHRQPNFQYPSQFMLPHYQIPLVYPQHMVTPHHQYRFTHHLQPHASRCMSHVQMQKQQLRLQQPRIQQLYHQNHHHYQMVGNYVAPPPLTLTSNTHPQPAFLQQQNQPTKEDKTAQQPRHHNPFTNGHSENVNEINHDSNKPTIQTHPLNAASSVQSQLVFQPMNNNDKRTLNGQQQTKRANSSTLIFETCPRSSIQEQTSRVDQAVPTFVLPHLTMPPARRYPSEPHLSHVPNRSANHTKTHNQVTETRIIHPSDPNFRLDDEIWYINGIPHRHARPIHNLHSSMPFYPQRQQQVFEVDNSGINRRVAEQVAKINQTFNDPTNLPAELGPKDDNPDGKSVNPDMGNFTGQSHRSENITLYPVYSDTSMTEAKTAFLCPRRKQSGTGMNDCGSNANNNNNIDKSSSASLAMPEITDVIIPDEENTCFNDVELDTNNNNIDLGFENTVCITEVEPNCTKASGFRSWSTDVNEMIPGYRNTGMIAKQIEMSKFEELFNNQWDEKFRTMTQELELGAVDNNLNTCTVPSDLTFGTVSSNDITSPTENHWGSTFANVHNGSNSIHGPFCANGPISELVRQSEIGMAEEESVITDVYNGSDAICSPFSANGLISAEICRQSEIGMVEKESKANEHERVDDCIRHIRVLGRNRHQKEKERVVRKRREINRSVLLQIV